jgi:hypothetical protein
MPYYPLLEIEAVFRDVCRDLGTLAQYIATLQTESAGLYPPDAALVLARVAQAHTLLTGAITPDMQQEITREHQRYAEDEAYWSRD